MFLKTIFMMCILSIQIVNSFYTHNGNLYMDNHEIFNIRGLSWFGFETPDFAINGLWVHNIDFYLDLLQQNQINVIRIPFSAEWVLYNENINPNHYFVQNDDECQSKTSFEILDLLFQKAADRNIYILLDLHRLNNEYISELWYSPFDSAYTTDTFFKTWYIMLDRYGKNTNLLGIDLLNEPHGKATFGSFDKDTDWRLFTEYAIRNLDNKYPSHSYVYFIEGINWGHTFQDYHKNPYPDDLIRQLVFSPHVYGKSVVPSTSSDINILHDQWYNDYGFLSILYNYTVIPGEWGGQTSYDADWMTIFGKYLSENNMRNNFLWSLGPNSGDVQGLLKDDWTTIDTFKMQLMIDIQPYPTIIS